MLSRVSEWINESIHSFFLGILNEQIETVTESLASMYSMAHDLMGLDFIRNTIVVVQVFAGSVMIVRILYQSLTTYILYQNGDPSQDPKKLLWETLTGAILVGFSPWVAGWVFALGTAIARDISSVVAFEVHSVPLVSLVVGSTVSFVLIALAAVILIFLILIQAAIRSVEVALLAVMGPVLGVAGLNSELFSAWWKNLLVISLTQAIQIFLLKGVFVMLAATNLEMGNYFLFALGFLWVAFKTPSILKEYAYSTGTGQAIGGAAGQAGSMYVMRRALTRV